MRAMCTQSSPIGLGNYFRALRDESYQQSGQGLSYTRTTALLRELKQEPNYSWLKEGDSQVLQQSLKDLGRAYENWFRMCREGKRPCNKGKPPRKDGKPRGYSRFKSRHGAQSIRYPQRFKLEGEKLYLPIPQHTCPAGQHLHCTQVHVCWE